MEKELEELRKAAKEFAMIGDAREYIKINKDDFIHKWFKVNQYFKYVINNYKDATDFLEAYDIVSDISIDNPTLEVWVNDWIFPEEKLQKKQDSIDLAEISGPIESLVLEVSSMQYWDPKRVEDIEWELQEYRNRLMSNKEKFEPSMYQSLLDDINMSLGKIERFNGMVNSDMIDNISRGR